MVIVLRFILDSSKSDLLGRCNFLTTWEPPFLRVYRSVWGSGMFFIWLTHENLPNPLLVSLIRLVKLYTNQKRERCKMVEKKIDRKYPPFYEKFVPIAIGLLALVVVGVLVFTIAVGVGVLKFGS